MQPNSIAHQQALELFLKTDFSQKQIAEMLNVNRKTVGTWVQQGRWHDLKNLESNTKAFLLQDLYTQLRALNSNINARESAPFPTVEESAIQRRLIMSINSFNIDPLNDYVQSVLHFVKDLGAIEPDLAGQIEGYMYYVIESRRKKIQPLDDLQNPPEDDLLDEQTETSPTADTTDQVVSKEADAALCDVKEDHIYQQDQPFQPGHTPTDGQNNFTQNSGNTGHFLHTG